MEVLDGSSWRSAACLLADMGQRAMERNEVCLTSALNALKDPMQWPRAVEQVKMVVQQQFVACQALCGRWQYGLQLMPSEPLVGPPRCNLRPRSKLLLSMSKQSLWRRAMRGVLPQSTPRCNVEAETELGPC